MWVWHRCSYPDSDGGDSGLDPITRWDLWRSQELLSRIIVQQHMTEGLENFKHSAEEIARDIANEPSGRARSITGPHVIEIFQMLRFHVEGAGNPYAKWGKVCNAFRASLNGHNISFTRGPGEASKDELLKRVKKLMLEQLGVDGDVSRYEHCVERYIDEMVHHERSHKHHNGACAMPYRCRIVMPFGHKRDPFDDDDRVMPFGHRTHLFHDQDHSDHGYGPGPSRSGGRHIWHSQEYDDSVHSLSSGSSGRHNERHGDHGHGYGAPSRSHYGESDGGCFLDGTTLYGGSELDGGYSPDGTTLYGGSELGFGGDHSSYR